eukprot:gene3047-3811_t
MGCHNATYAFLKLGPSFAGSVAHLHLKHTPLQCFDPELGIGYQMGVVGRLGFVWLYIQPECRWTHSQIKYSERYNPKKYTLQFQKIEFPILLGIKMLGIGSLQVGPTFSYMLTSKKDGIEASLRYGNKLTVGYQVGIGVDIHRLMLSVRYEGNLSKVCTTLCKVPVDQRESIFILSIGLNILGS